MAALPNKTGRIVSEYVDPDSLYYTQDFISENFPGGALIEDTLRKLKSGELSVASVPPVKVVLHNGRPYCFDNHGLWVFKNLGQKIPVVYEQKKGHSFFLKLNRDPTLPKNKITILRNTNSSSNAKEKSLGLIEQVLMWGLDDLEAAAQDIVKAPEVFASSEQYQQIFSSLLLTELREKLCSSLQKYKLRQGQTEFKDVTYHAEVSNFGDQYKKKKPQKNLFLSMQENLTQIKKKKQKVKMRKAQAPAAIMTAN